MKLLKKDFKGKTRIILESLDDMWNMMNIISPGDEIGAKTLRTLQTSNEKEKRPVYLNIVVDKVDFSEETGNLRITGKIIDGPDDIKHGYHTLTLKEKDTFEIKKDWKKYEIDRLEKSLRTKKIDILAALVDEHCANFYNIRENSISELGKMVCCLF